MGADWGCKEQASGFTGRFYWFDHYWHLENQTDVEKLLKRTTKPRVSEKRHMKDEDKVKGVFVLLNLFLNIKVTKSDCMKLTLSNRRTQALAQTNTSFSCLSTPLIPALNCRDPEWQTVAPPSNPNQKIYLIHTPTNPHLHTHLLTSHPYPDLFMFSSSISTLTDVSSGAWQSEENLCSDWMTDWIRGGATTRSLIFTEEAYQHQKKAFHLRMLTKTNRF